jgi:hypothetical protein
MICDPRTIIFKNTLEHVLIYYWLRLSNLNQPLKSLEAKFWPLLFWACCYDKKM